MKKTIFFLSFAVLGYMIFAGQVIKDDSPRWSRNTAYTEIYPAGNYVPLPAVPDNFYRFTTQPRIVQTPYEILVVNPNMRVLPSTSTAQTEVILCSNPVNRSIMFGSSNNVTGNTINSGCFVTTDGGVTWGGWQVMNAPSSADQRGDPGPAIDKNGTFIFSHLTSSSNFGGVTGIGCNRSSNNGANWDATIMVETNINSDKNLTGTDDSPTSPYYGYSYAAWCVLSSPATSRVARTTNSGLNWTTQTVSTSIAGHYVQGHDVACGPNGEVYVAWVANMASSPYTADYISLGKSTNGGANYTVQDMAIDVNGARSASLSPWTIRTNDFPRIDVDKSGGPRNGWIYIVINEKNNAPLAGTDPDVVCYHSSNGGANFTGVRVNQDPINNGKNQIFPAVKVDPSGGVNVIYYDSRQWAANDSAAVYISRSLDGGNIWTDVEISDHHFRPKTASGMGGNYMGDYIGIAIGAGKIFGNWMDDKAGASAFYNSWVGSIDLGPAISHIPLTTTEQTTGTRAVNCVITTAGSPITAGTTKLFFTKNPALFSDSVVMTNSGGNNWNANLTLSGVGTYRYYIKTKDDLNRVATAPSGAPLNYYSFVAMTDTTRPVITHTPLADVPKANWPAVVTATVTDNIGVDSVWVKWYKNTPTTIKQFKLPNAGGSVYSAAFNSIPADVNYNDSIFYRVFARDSSSSHLADSTPLRKFKIIAQATTCIGTGTTSTAYPFYTFYHDSRTQMLYNSSEIIAGGGAPGFITKIGFKILTVGSPDMTNFSIKMQTISASTITTWTSTGWTNVYSGTYVPPGTGLQYIDLQTPYPWNGTGNLLIEICFDNTSYVANTTVEGTAQTQTVMHNHVDNGAGCTLTATSTSATRPNVCMIINTAVGVNPIGNTIPSVFSLSQNYPNPFNPTTQIRYDIPKQTFVTLKVYDLLGREITKLVSEVKQPGSYIVDFNASNLSSGVYFYKLEAGAFESVKRMVLLK